MSVSEPTMKASASEPAAAADSPPSATATTSAPPVAEQIPVDSVGSAISEERMAELQLELLQLQTSAAQIDAAKEDLENWSAGRRDSFVWKFSALLAAERETATADLQRAQAEVDRINLPNPKQLRAITDQFIHRLKLASLYWLAFSLGLWLLRDIAQRMSDSGVRAGSLTALFVSLVLYVLANAYFLKVLVGIFVSFFLTFCGQLLLYYREWSNFARRVDVSIARLDHFGELDRHAYQESERMRILHRHALRVMRILAHALRSPFTLPATVDEDPAIGLHDSALPLSVRFGRVDRIDDAQNLKMRRQALRLLVHKSWRSRIFETLVSHVGNGLGFESREFNLTQIDRDLSSNASQVLQTLENHISDALALEATGLSVHDELANSVRQQVMPTVEMFVDSIHDDPMDGFDWPHTTQSRTSWRDFLHAIFNNEAVENTPAPGSQVLNDTGRAMDVVRRQSTKSIALVPSNFVVAESGLTVEHTGTESQSDIDLAVRADITGPLERGSFTVFSSDGLGQVSDPQAIPTEAVAEEL